MRYTKMITGIGMSLLLGSTLAFAQTTAVTADNAATAMRKCSQCVIRWVDEQATGTDSGATFTYREMQCPKCRSALTNLFTRGELRHSCSNCVAEKTNCHHDEISAKASDSVPTTGD